MLIVGKKICADFFLFVYKSLDSMVVEVKANDESPSFRPSY